MDFKELIKFGLEESSEPIIKNPVLRNAMAEGGRMGFAQRGLVRYGDKKYTSPMKNPDIAAKNKQTQKINYQTKDPVGKRLQWIADNGKNFDSPKEFKKAYEKKWGHKIGSKEDVLFHVGKGGGPRGGKASGKGKKINFGKIDGLDNPGKTGRGSNLMWMKQNFSEDEIFKGSILQNNPKIQKQFKDLFQHINDNAGLYAEMGPEEMVNKLRAKGNNLIDDFDFLKSHSSGGVQTYGGVHKGITRNSLKNIGVPEEHITSFQSVRKPIEAIEKILEKIKKNPNYAKHTWGIGAGTSKKIGDQLDNFLSGQKDAFKVVRDIDNMLVDESMKKEGFKGTRDAYLKTEKGKLANKQFNKVFGGVNFEHTLAKSVGKDYKYLPRNYMLKGQYTTGAFNQIKKNQFDLPLIDMLKKHKEGKLDGSKITEFIEDFNKKTGGYADFVFDEKAGKLVYPNEKKVTYDLSKYKDPKMARKELKKNIEMTMSKKFQRGFAKADTDKLAQLRSKKAKSILIKLGCGMYAGGRVGLKKGGDTCINNAIKKLKDSKNLTAAEKQLAKRLAGVSGLKKLGGWAKAEGYFVLADMANNWTKGQSFQKGISEAVKTGTFGLIDMKGAEKDLDKVLKEQNLSKEEMQGVHDWMDYAKKEGKLDKGIINENLMHEDIGVYDDSGGMDEAAIPVTTQADADAYTKKVDELERLRNEAAEKADWKGYNAFNKGLESLIAKEWNKTAGTIFDRGYRKMLGAKGDEGGIWGPTFGNLFREGMEAAGYEEHKALKSFKPQEVMNYHPVYGYQEKIKDIIRQGDSPMEDVLYQFEKYMPSSAIQDEALYNDPMGTYDYDPNLGTRQYQAGGGIAGIRRPSAIPPESGPTPYGLPSMLNRVKKV